MSRAQASADAERLLAHPDDPRVVVIKVDEATNRSIERHSSTADGTAIGPPPVAVSSRVDEAPVKDSRDRSG